MRDHEEKQSWEFIQSILRKEVQLKEVVLFTSVGLFLSVLSTLSYSSNFFLSQKAFLLLFQLHNLFLLWRSPCRAVCRKLLSDTVLKHEIIGYSAKPECSGLKQTRCHRVNSGPFLSVLGKSLQSSVFFTHFPLMRSLSHSVDALNVQAGLLF